MSRHRAAIRAFAIVAACAVAPNAWAQRAAGPYAGLFGGARTTPRPSRPSHDLSLRWSAYEGYDEVARDETGNPVPESELQRSGVYGALSASLGFQRRSDKLRMSFNTGVMARAYGRSFNLSSPTYSASGSIGFPLGRRTQVNASFGGGYSAFYQFTPFIAMLSADESTVTPGYGAVAANRRSISTYTSLGVSQRLWSKASIGADTGFYRRMFLDGNDARMQARSQSVMFQQGLTRGLGVHAGYRSQSGLFNLTPGVAGPSIRNFDVGLDFSKALSFSRRTTVTFGTGSAMADSVQGSRYDLTAQAAVTEQIGRTWSVTFNVSRGTQFVEGLRDVVFADSIAGSVHGLMTPRVELTSTVATSSGTVGVQTQAPHFGSYTGSSKLAVGVTRRLGVFVQYTFYHYDVPPGSPTALDFRPRMTRQSAMIGLSGWFPIVEDSRGSRGSR